MKLFNYMKKHLALSSFLLSLLLSSFFIVPYIITGKGIFTITMDFNYLQIPFNKLMNNEIKGGSFLYTWLNDLGSNFIGTFSFYNLASPFNIISYLFPASWFPYLIGPLLILKYGVAGFTSYLFLQRYVKNKNYALLGSLMYSFSGFQFTNMMFFHFHDVVAFFPLFLYALDELVYNKKRGLFALTTALLAITNYIFFVGEVVFVILFYLVRVITKNYKFTWSSFFNILFEGIIGTCISMFILLPSVLFVLGNPRLDVTWTFKSALFYNFSTYSDILRALILPSESMAYRTTIYEGNCNSLEAFLPLIGSLLVINYIIKKPKDTWSVMLICFFTIMFIPILNSTFYLFNTNYYARWFYMPILIMVLTSIIYLDKKMKCKKGIYIQTILLILLMGLLLLAKHYDSIKIIQDEKYFVLRSILFLSCIIYTLYSLSKKKNNKFLLIGVIIYIIIAGNLSVYECRKTFKNDKIFEKYYLDVSNNIKIDTSSYRADASVNCLPNFGYMSNKIIIHSFNSNISAGAFKFYNSIGFNRSILTFFSDDDTKIRDFLSIKYLLSCGKSSSFNNYYKKIYDDNNFSIYENPNVHMMGIDYNYYMDEKEYNKLDLIKKNDLLDKVIILDKENIKKYNKYLKKYNDEENESKIIKNNFKFINNGFDSQIELKNDSIILYTIPYEKGWNIKVNGKSVRYDETSNGFIILKLSKGKNIIKGSYVPSGLKEGIIVTVLSLFIFVIYIINYFKNKKKAY